MPEFVGRQEQLSVLNALFERVRADIGTPSPGKCLLMRGRRRVGKSRLVEVFVESTRAPTLFFTASRQGKNELNFFTEEAVSSNLPGANIFADVTLSTWDAALRVLSQALPADEPSVVVVDEFPYLVEHDAAVEATFQKQWDRLLSRKPVLLILIGSDLSMMEALNSHDRAFFQRGTEMVVSPLSPAETASVVGAPSAAEGFDAYLLTGGLPLICTEWQKGTGMWEYLEDALSSPTSALIVSAERSLAAEFPVDALARDVLGQIGAGETTFTNIARAAGGLRAMSLNRALDLLTTKRMVVRDLPLSTKPSKEARYRVADPYLRFWLTFIGPHLAEIERGRSDRVLRRAREGWASWRGRAIEPVVREALLRLLPYKGLTGEAVGAYWARTNVPEVDLIGADRAPLAKTITFVGTIKWYEDALIDNADINRLVVDASQVPGVSATAPLVAVSRTGVSATTATVALGPEDLMAAWS